MTAPEPPYVQEVDLVNTQLFEYVKSYNASLLILRSLLFLDQCHDFVQNDERNAWNDRERIRAHKLLLQKFKDDLAYIETVAVKAGGDVPTPEEANVYKVLGLMLPTTPYNPATTNNFGAPLGGAISKKPPRAAAEARARALARNIGPSSEGSVAAVTDMSLVGGRRLTQPPKILDPSEVRTKPRAVRKGKKVVARIFKKPDQKSDFEISAEKMNAEDFNNVDTRDKIIRIAHQFQIAAGIVDYDPSKDQEGVSRTDFNMFTYAEILPTLLDTEKESKKFLVGADADKSFAHFCAMSVSLYENSMADGGDMQIFESPATAYDAAGKSGVINYLKQIVAIKNNSDDKVVTVPQLSSVYTPYTLQLVARDTRYIASDNPLANTPVISLTYYPSTDVGPDQNGVDVVKLNVPPYFLITNFFFSNPGTRVAAAAQWEEATGRLKKYSLKYLTKNYKPDDDIFLYKTMGDFGQILSFFATYNDKRQGAQNRSFNEMYYNPIFTSFDRISAVISSMFNKSTILETDTAAFDSDGMSKTRNNLLVFKPVGYAKQQLGGKGLLPIMNNLPPKAAKFAVKTTEAAREWFDQGGRAIERTRAWGASIRNAALASYNRRFNPNAIQQNFGKKSNKISVASTNDLKIKLKSVGINVTKVTRSGKRLPLTRKELEAKAKMFKNLQLRAKKMNVRLMFKSKRRGYVYKSYTRLTNDIQRKGKMKFG